MAASIPLLGVIIYFQEFFKIANFSDLFKLSFFSLRLRKTLFFRIKGLFLILGFLVKFPIFFFHTWLPRAHVEAPVRGSIILAAILLKLAGFGIFRFSCVIFPLQILIFIKNFRIIGGALIRILCIFEKDIKKLIAYTSVAHIRFVIFVYLSKSKFGIAGGSIIMLSHGICSSGLFSGTNQMTLISKSRSLLFNQGFIVLWPRFSLFWFLRCLANLGAPPTLNFFREIICIINLVQNRIFRSLPVALLTFFAAGYSLILYRNTQYGRFLKIKIVDLKSRFQLSNLIHRIFLFLLVFFLIF